MKIRCAEPIQGRAEPLCKTDEAVISRIFTKGGRELVERLQKFPRSTEDSSLVFGLGFTSVHTDRSPPTSSLYHLMKALSLATAHSLFPKTFLQCHEVRFFKSGGERYSAMYSDYVPDDTGVIARRYGSMRRYYLTPYTGSRETIANEFDRQERSLNPELGLMVRRLAYAGIKVPHPEANYHVSDGNTVFFEVTEINLPSTVSLARQQNNTLALSYLAMIYASYVRVLTDHKLTKARGSNLALDNVYQTYQRESFAALKRVFHQIFLSPSDAVAMIDAAYDAVKSSLGHWNQMIMDSGTSKDIEMPEEMGQEIDSVLRDEY